MTQMVGLRSWVKQQSRFVGTTFAARTSVAQGEPETARPDFFDPSLYYAPTLCSACVDTRVSNKFSDLVRGQSENVPGLFMSLSYFGMGSVDRPSRC